MPQLSRFSLFVLLFLASVSAFALEVQKTCIESFEKSPIFDEKYLSVNAEGALNFLKVDGVLDRKEKAAFYTVKDNDQKIVFEFKFQSSSDESINHVIHRSTDSTGTTTISNLWLNKLASGKCLAEFSQYATNPKDSAEEMMKRMKESSISRKTLEISGPWKESTKKISIKFEMCNQIIKYELSEEKIYSHPREHGLPLKIQLSQIKNEVLKEEDNEYFVSNLSKDSKIFNQLKSDFDEIKALCEKYQNTQENNSVIHKNDKSIGR